MSNICIWRSRLKAYNGTNSPFLQLIDMQTHYHLFPWIRTDLLRHNCQLSFCTWISCGTWSVIHHLWYPEIYHKPIYALLPHVGPLWNLSQQWSLSIVGAQQPWVIESHPSDDLQLWSQKYWRIITGILTRIRKYNTKSRPNAFLKVFLTVPLPKWLSTENLIYG